MKKQIWKSGVIRVIATLAMVATLSGLRNGFVQDIMVGQPDRGAGAVAAFCQEDFSLASASAALLAPSAGTETTPHQPYSHFHATAEVDPEIKLCPGGMPFGVKFFTKGLLIVGFSDIDTADGDKNPARDSGLKIGDIITAVNGREINAVEEMVNMVQESKGRVLELTYLRNNQPHTVSITPRSSSSDGKYKTGMWIRDSAAGIGTVTYINPSTHAFGGLGHGICDSESGELLTLLRGTVVDVSIHSIVKGISGSPGEMKGTLNANKTGTLVGNTNAGVYGVLSDCKVREKDALPIARSHEVKEGPAQILCMLDGDKCEYYDVTISCLHEDSVNFKNYVVTVTDNRLIEKTGGIVQGMSGSPVIQEGKLVGAVTHVLINDPTKGYGIFIENMLRNMPEILQ